MVDFRTSIGEPIKTTGDGVITRAIPTDTGGYGKLIVVRHSYGFDTVYAHLSSIKVRVGQKVKKRLIDRISRQ